MGVLGASRGLANHARRIWPHIGPRTDSPAYLLPQQALSELEPSSSFICTLSPCGGKATKADQQFDFILLDFKRDVNTNITISAACGRGALIQLSSSQNITFVALPETWVGCSVKGLRGSIAANKARRRSMRKRRCHSHAINTREYSKEAVDEEKTLASACD